MDLELRHLRAFVAVADDGSFTAAAERLHFSQATVSRAVAGLEAAVGGRVLWRTTREIGLTPLGQRILGPARRILDEAAFIAHANERSDADIRIGYAWAALGRHTIDLQRRWAGEFPGSELRFVQSSTPTSGLAEGEVDAAVLRRTVDDERFEAVLAGVEQRFAALSTTDPLARRRSITLADFADRVVAIDDRTGTTTIDLWPADCRPSRTRVVHGIEDWLTLIAAGPAIGITAEATTHQYPRPGVKYRPVRDAQPIPVWLAWRRDDPPANIDQLVRLVCEAYTRA
ncbi:MAG: LysR family transcriptional regulator [Acidimicrobiales bacterium]|nr:LysR family transcriptional regulator [Acidimicrobiales bacterium]